MCARPMLDQCDQPLYAGIFTLVIRGQSVTQESMGRGVPSYHNPHHGPGQ